MGTLDTIQKDVQAVSAIVGVISPLTGEVIQIGTATIAAAQAIKTLLGGVAKNGDGTPMTDADFAAHFATAESKVETEIAHADANAADDEARLKAAGSGE